MFETIRLEARVYAKWLKFNRLVFFPEICVARLRRVLENLRRNFLETERGLHVRESL